MVKIYTSDMVTYKHILEYGDRLLLFTLFMPNLISHSRYSTSVFRDLQLIVFFAIAAAD